MPPTRPDEVVRAVYEVLSGPASSERDWDRFRTFYHPDARLMPVSSATTKRANVDVLDVEGYIASRRCMLAEADFYEVESASSVAFIGRVAHVLSAYEARRSREGEPFVRSVNSVQLVCEGGNWLILSVAWDVDGASV